MIPGHAARNALPSGSFGHLPATILLVGMRSHIGMKQPPNASTPKKYIVVYLNGCGFLGRPAARSTTPATERRSRRTGTPGVSHTVATGLVVSGVELVTTMSAWSWRISSRATWDARLGSDWLSLTTISTV